MAFSHIDIEETFSDFVEEIGGIVSDRVPSKGNKAVNADYIFHDDKVIIELKLLKEDPSKNKNWHKSIQQKQHKWLQTGDVTLAELQRSIKADQINLLPDKCYNDILKLYMRPIKYQIETANKQIKATKRNLDLPDHKGLLIIGSDGNYFLQPKHVRHFVARILKNELLYKSINTAIYFTANVVTTRPNDPTFSRLWVNLYRDKSHFENVPLQFLKRLYEGWAEYYRKITGIELDILSNLDEQGITEEDHLEDTVFVVPPPRIQRVDS
jgi:hypothetical protein